MSGRRETKAVHWAVDAISATIMLKEIARKGRAVRGL
jgi:hypothetical protein